MDEVERLLRLLALNDEESVGRVLASEPHAHLSETLNQKEGLLVRIAALLALGAATSSLRTTVDHAIRAGASEAEITDVLIAVGPALGVARVVMSAPRLAMALGYEIDDED